MTSLVPSPVSTRPGPAASDGDGRASATTDSIRAAIVAPRHKHRADWPWLEGIGAMASFDLSQRHFIDPVFSPIPKLSGVARRWRYWRAAQAIGDAQIAFSFSTDINIGLAEGLAGRTPQPPRVYVGFTQDGPWEQARIDRLARAMQQCAAVTVFTEEERGIYIDRYGIAPERIHVIPIHTDDTEGYAEYGETSPVDGPYAVALGITNRRFTETARICRDLEIPLVILTRPHHQNDDLDELANLGATIVTDANQTQAWTYLKHAHLATAVFMNPTMPGGYTTLMNAMFMRTPFIATRCLGMDEHVIDGETGFVVDHEDFDTLRERIDRLWNEDGLAGAFGMAAAERGDARHSLTAAAERFNAVARGVLEEEAS